MPGGLIQLVNKGAQDQLTTGNPTFTHFRSVYKRHTEFALEHFVLNFRGTNLDLHPQFTRTFRAKVERNAQLLHDCYIKVSLPDIFSPVYPLKRRATGPINSSSTAIGYEFQWIPNIGYNMINSVSVLVNGTAIVTHTGEWMKLYSYVTHDGTKRSIVDKMVGNLTELTDPANAFDRVNQYPHSITRSGTYAAPSIKGRDLTIPLHFWFCENIGAALPLISLQYSEVEIVVEFKRIYDLFTVRDVRQDSPTFGMRIAPDVAAQEFAMNHFLSPPEIDTTPENPSLSNWALSPYIEATYIFLSDAEMVQLAKSDNSFMIKESRVVQLDGVYGPGNDLELTMANLCTRIVWIAQRSDVIASNGVDNYTNWHNPNPPIAFDPTLVGQRRSISPWFTSGPDSGQNVTDNSILIDATLIVDGTEREQTKPQSFYNLLQNYKHHTGPILPGIYTYSFAIDHDTTQPSGHINGSMFNKTILRLTAQDPPAPDPANNGLTLQEPGPPVCVLKSTVFNRNPTVVTAQQLASNTLSPEDVVQLVTKNELTIRNHTYTVRAYVESYNFLRIARGIANVVFSS